MAGNITKRAQTQFVLGQKVTRAAADIFSGAQIALFNVYNGPILLTHIRVTTSVAAMDATNNLTQLIANPTVGGDAPLCATLDVVSAALGAVFSITGTVGDAMTGLLPGGGAMCQDRPIIVPTGTIDIDGSADSGVGGALGAVEIWYLPLADNAYVTAT
jgi:hypothetical protein